MTSELRQRGGKKKKEEKEEESEEEIVQEPEEVEEEEEREIEEKKQKEQLKAKQKTRTRARKSEDEPIYASKTIEYTVAIVRMILILVVFTILHGWVTKYILDPYMGRDQNNLHFTCPEGMDCEKIRQHLEKVHFKE